VATIVFIPLFAIWSKNALPYFVAYIQHSLIGDFIAGGRTQLFWPLTSQLYGIEISIKSLTNITLEWVIFLAAAIVLIKSRDLQILLQPNNSNLLLLIPTCTVLLPTFLAFPIDVPLALVTLHIVFLALFSASLLIDIKRFLTRL
jgi:hypothetical protein